MSKITCGIEKLKKLTILDANGNLMDYEYPTKEETMNKINEIIDRLDKLAESEARIKSL